MNIFKRYFSSKKENTSISNASGAVEYIIVGLGNPGIKYENTRHNAGFIAIDYISSELGVGLTSSKFKGLCTNCELCGKKVMLLKPQTFMNESGQAVLEAIKFYKVPPEKTIILFDDISLPVGKMRIKRSGSHGGQNGMKNIINLCGTDKFPRIKIGIGNKPNPNWDLADWVLSKFSEEERKAIHELMPGVKKSVELIINGEIDTAMCNYN